MNRKLLRGFGFQIFQNLIFVISFWYFTIEVDDQALKETAQWIILGVVFINMTLIDLIEFNDRLKKEIERVEG